jgi:conjugal transfer mating pair stabilization protein TraG
MLRLKSDVKIDKLQPQMVLCLSVVEAAFKDRGYYDTMITSGNDGVHMVGSLHPLGRALDFRTNMVQDMVAKKRGDVLRDIALSIASALPGYDVLLEDVGLPNEHLHIEFDPPYLKEPAKTS